MEIQPLQGHHDTEAFTCGDDVLDAWIHRTAKQHIRKGISRSFVAIEQDNNEKISDVLGISSQLSMVLLNIFNSVGSDLKYKHFSNDTVINSVIFIIVVTLIMKYNA